jgi:hypothetical protein
MAKQQRTREMQQLIATCGARAFSELVLARVAGRSASISDVLGRDGLRGLLAIAAQVGAAMDHLPPNEKALSVVGAEVGILIGLAVGLVVSESGPRTCVEPGDCASVVH